MGMMILPLPYNGVVFMVANHRIIEIDDLLYRPSCLPSNAASFYSTIFSALSSRVLKVLSDGASTTSLGRIFHKVMHFTARKLFLIYN